MDDKVIDLLRRVFEGYDINEKSSCDTIADWDSIHQLNIAFEIESEFGVSIEPEEMQLLKSVKEIRSFLNTRI